MDRRTLLKYSLMGIASTALGGSLQSIVRASEGHGSSPHWGYAGNSGPSHWGRLSESYQLCSAGREQSPIDLNHAIDSDLDELMIDYGRTSANVLHNGHTIQVNCDPGSRLILDGRGFELLQFHFHTPSEHTVEGRPYSMELHFVHANEALGALAVLGVFMEEGDENTELRSLWQAMPMHESPEQRLAGLTIDLADLLPRHPNELYRYYGSLTTPPCSETVNWLVLKHSISVSTAQITQFAEAIGGLNARPTQPIHRRFILES